MNLTEKQLARGCRHFTGLSNPTCAQHIRYDTLDWNHFPCLSDWHHPGISGECALRSWYTVEEIEAEEQQRQEAMKKWEADLAAGICPTCGQKLTSKRQIGRCVYGSCGCRLYQGRL